MGGRGASSENSTKVVPYERMVTEQRIKMTHLYFNKGIDIHEQGYVPRSYNISKGLEQIKNRVNEAVVEVDKGMIEKRMKQLKELGFKVKERTAYKEDDEPWKSVRLYIKK